MSRSAIEIVPMRRRHLKTVVGLESVAYPRPWSRRVFERELEQSSDGSRTYLVAKQGRSVVGYAGLWFVADPDGTQAHLTNVVVDPSVRRQGVARRLLVRLADEARHRGAVAWTLEVRASASGAQELYRRFGFAPAGIRTKYYENTEDAIVMWCHDLDSDEYGRRLDGLREPAPVVGAAPGGRR